MFSSICLNCSIHRIQKAIRWSGGILSKERSSNISGMKLEGGIMGQKGTDIGGQCSGKDMRKEN